MSIDARVVAVTIQESQKPYLTLTARDPNTAPAGQSRLTIENAPDDKSRLLAFIGAEVWGSSGVLMAGEKAVGRRSAPCNLTLGPEWEAALASGSASGVAAQKLRCRSCQSPLMDWEQQPPYLCEGCEADPEKWPEPNEEKR